MLQPSSLCYAVPSLTRLVKNEARLSPYEAHCSNAAMYEAPLGSGMKRSLGRLHFLPKAKMVPGAGAITGSISSSKIAYFVHFTLKLARYST